MLKCEGDKVTSHGLKFIGRQIKAKNYHFDGISIVNTSVVHIYNDTITAKDYFFISIAGNQNLTSIESHAFSGNVKNFEFFANLKADKSIFTAMKNLNITERIEMNFNNFSVIPENAFNSSAKQIDLFYNFIKKIGSNAFSSSPNLEFLNLKNNLIDTIDNYGLNFTTNKMNKTISLFNNRLSSKSFAVNSLPKLANNSITINLKENFIDKLPEKVFKPFLQEESHTILLDNNQIKCDCYMKWIIEEPQSNHINDVYCVDKKKSIFDLDSKEFNCQYVSPSTPIKNTKQLPRTEPTLIKARL
jgi:hypothetical protein